MDKTKAPAGSSSAEAKVAPVIPKEKVQAVLNPKNEPSYSGPIGTVRGVVHVSGDPAPAIRDPEAQIPAGRCDDARAFYGKLFREGPNRELGDVLIAVTNYKGYVPPPDADKMVVAKGCAFESRTVALVFGRNLEVSNRGPETFIPDLKGAHQPALLVAVPGGQPVTLYPDHVGQFLLVDRSHPFAKADVFVLKYPTTAVTGLDGKFEITGIPAGSAIVTAYLPATKGQASQKVTVVSGQTLDVDLTIPFSVAPPSPRPAPSP